MRTASIATPFRHSIDGDAARNPIVGRSISPAIGGVLRVIDTSFAQPLNLDTLASIAGLSVSRFTARFRSEVGLSPHRYLCVVRVRRAQDLLRDGQPPSLVATEVGFFDQSHLCRHFRRVLGVTPRHYVSGRADAARDAPGRFAAAGRVRGEQGGAVYVAT